MQKPQTRHRGVTLCTPQPKITKQDEQAEDVLIVSFKEL
jgi:hypothetical protein